MADKTINIVGHLEKLVKQAEKFGNVLKNIHFGDQNFDKNVKSLKDLLGSTGRQTQISNVQRALKRVTDLQKRHIGVRGPEYQEELIERYKAYDTEVNTLRSMEKVMGYRSYQSTSSFGHAIEEARMGRGWGGKAGGFIGSSIGSAMRGEVGSRKGGAVGRYVGEFTQAALTVGAEGRKAQVAPRMAIMARTGASQLQVSQSVAGYAREWGMMPQETLAIEEALAKMGPGAIRTTDSVMKAIRAGGIENGYATGMAGGLRSTGLTGEALQAGYEQTLLNVFSSGMDKSDMSKSVGEMLKLMQQNNLTGMSGTAMGELMSAMFSKSGYMSTPGRVGNMTQKLLSSGDQPMASFAFKAYYDAIKSVSKGKEPDYFEVKGLYQLGLTPEFSQTQIESMPSQRSKGWARSLGGAKTPFRNLYNIAMQQPAQARQEFLQNWGGFPGGLPGMTGQQQAHWLLGTGGVLPSQADLDKEFGQKRMDEEAKKAKGSDEMAVARYMAQKEVGFTQLGEVWNEGVSHFVNAVAEQFWPSTEKFVKSVDRFSQITGGIAETRGHDIGWAGSKLYDYRSTAIKYGPTPQAIYNLIPQDVRTQMWDKVSAKDSYSNEVNPLTGVPKSVTFGTESAGRAAQHEWGRMHSWLQWASSHKPWESPLTSIMSGSHANTYKHANGLAYDESIRDPITKEFVSMEEVQRRVDWYKSYGLNAQLHTPGMGATDVSHIEVDAANVKPGTTPPWELFELQKRSVDAQERTASAVEQQSLTSIRGYHSVQ